MARNYPQSAAILARNSRYIPGGVTSTNRAAQPEIVFTRAEGAYLWDAEGNRYVDYHAAFAPYVLGHNDAQVNAAVERALRDQASLFGSGTTLLEGRLAELICTRIPWVERVEFLNSGSEATAQAVRLARAATGREHVIVMQGGYNGWHNDVAYNLMTPIAAIGARRSPGEYPLAPLSAGIPQGHQRLIHAINFNDLDSVRWVCERNAVAALISEPILQNVGIVHPRPGYLAGLRRLADELGFVLIFDEVKTGFRHAFGGYAEISGVRPHLVVYGKAIANGYPLAAVGGKRELMDYFVHSDAEKRVMLAGTYNAHPVATAAAIATLERLLANGGEVYRHIYRLGERMERGLMDLARNLECEFVVARQGSAFSFYFMSEPPADWHAIAEHHDFELDVNLRRQLIDRGVYVFPVATKQWSISAAHTEADIDWSLHEVAQVLAGSAVVAS